MYHKSWKTIFDKHNINFVANKNIYQVIEMDIVVLLQYNNITEYYRI